MNKYRVYSLDVWGHGPDECAQYDCDGNCDGYQVNDRCKVGTVEIEDDTGPAPIIAALVSAGYLTADCSEESIDVDGDGEFMVEINRKSDGKYLLQLEPTTIIARYSLADLPHKTKLLPWQKQGLQYTRSGYGNKIPTTIMVQLPGSPRWRRVYCCIWSNIGTCYVPQGDKWIVISN